MKNSFKSKKYVLSKVFFVITKKCLDIISFEAAFAQQIKHKVYFCHFDIIKK